MCALALTHTVTGAQDDIFAVGRCEDVACEGGEEWRLATGGADGRARLWDVAGGVCLGSWGGPGGVISAVALALVPSPSPSPRISHHPGVLGQTEEVERLYLGSGEGGVSVVELGSGEAKLLSEPSGAAVTAIVARAGVVAACPHQPLAPSFWT